MVTERTRGRICVRGRSVLQPPMLESSEAEIVEIYDVFADLMALLVRLKDDIWSLVTKEDPDWKDTLVRYGYAQHNRPMEAILRNEC